MELKETNKNIACDIMGCKHVAKFCLKNGNAIFNNSMFLCSNCIKEMHGLFSKVVTPKSIKNIYKKEEK